jgi:hypothetical protein
MLVVSRKKHESIVIDGSIHVEVVSHMKDLVWVKLLTPRSLMVTVGSKKPLRENSLSTKPKAVNGHDQLNLAIGTREFVRLGESIVLGLVDADTSRALFLVDVPRGTKVVAQTKQELAPEVRSTGQSLLQFMEPGERLKRDQQVDAGDLGKDGGEPKKNGVHAGGMKATGMKRETTGPPPRKRLAGPSFLPFPSVASAKKSTDVVSEGSSGSSSNSTNGQGPAEADPANASLADSVEVAKQNGQPSR